MTDFFISYSQKDDYKVKLMIRALKSIGYSLWWDEKGENKNFHYNNIHEVMAKKIKESKNVITCWSPNYVESRYCQEEAALAKFYKNIIVIIIHPVLLKDAYKDYPYIDFTTWNSHSDSPEIRKLCHYEPTNTPPKNTGIIDNTVHPTLIWKTYDEGNSNNSKYSFNEAKEMVNKENKEEKSYGLDQWRIPNEYELSERLVDLNIHSALNLKNDFYWSMTSYNSYKEKKWTFHMGYKISYGKVVNEKLRLRLVCSYYEQGHLFK